MLGNDARMPGCRLRKLRGIRRRGEARGKDSVGVPVLHKWISGKCTIAAADCDHRDLAIEGNPGFENRRRAGQRLPRGIQIGAAAQAVLALAIVAKSPRLQYRWI